MQSQLELIIQRQKNTIKELLYTRLFAMFDIYRTFKSYI